MLCFAAIGVDHAFLVAVGVDYAYHTVFSAILVDHAFLW
jgi:hypothetical protein